MMDSEPLRGQPATTTFWELSSDHPFWVLMNRALLAVVVVVVLRMNATNFDWTEWKSILEIGAAIVVYDGGRLGIRKWIEKHESNE